MVRFTHRMRLLLVLLTSMALHAPAAVVQARDEATRFQATFTGQGQLTVCGANVYCISDQATGSVGGLGAATLIANETERLVDPTSPCGFEVHGTATIAGAHGDALYLRFTLHTCGFGTDDGATIVKVGTFAVTGGAGKLAQASGGGSLYKIGLISSPAAVFELLGDVSGVSTPAAVQPTALTLGGAGCVITSDGVRCSVPTTNTIAAYTAAQCGTTAIGGQYVLRDRFAIAFDANGLAVRWHDEQEAPGTLSNAASGKTVPFLFDDTIDLRFAASGNFATATTHATGSGVLFMPRTIPSIRPDQLAYDGSGRLVLGALPALTQLCAILS